MLVVRKRNYPSLWNSLEPWDLSHFDREMNQLFHDFFHSGKVLGEGAFLPAIDIARSDGKITLTAELPGMAKSDLKVSVENGILTLKGEKKDEKEIKDKNRYRMECSYGTFQRSFTLPKGIKAEDISAKLKDGVLKISIPEPEEAKPKSIPVTAE